MRRRSFMGLLAGAVFTVLTAKVPVFAAEPLEVLIVPATGFHGAEAYTPLTDDQIADMVARAVARTSYKPNWGRPVARGPAPVGRLRHSFTEIVHIPRDRYIATLEAGNRPPLTNAERESIAMCEVMFANWSNVQYHLLASERAPCKACREAAGTRGEDPPAD